jgi:hypothetical protein
MGSTWLGCNLETRVGSKSRRFSWRNALEMWRIRFFPQEAESVEK